MLLLFSALLFHLLAIANTQNPQEVHKVRISLLCEPGNKVLNVAFPNAVDDRVVVLQEVSQHVRGVDVIPHLGLKEGDVSGHIMGVFLAATDQVLWKEENLFYFLV